MAKKEQSETKTKLAFLVSLLMFKLMSTVYVVYLSLIRFAAPSYMSNLLGRRSTIKPNFTATDPMGALAVRWF